MVNDVDSYLKELQTALAGADRALVQDALFDAEEYLQAEVASGAEFAQVMERYGTPQEVAAAYVGAAPTSEAVQADAPTAPATPSTPAVQPTMSETPTTVAPAPAGDTATARTGAPIYTEMAPGSQAPAQYDAPVGVQTGMVASSAGAATASPSAWRQVFGVFVDPRVYKALLYMILSLATGIAYFTIVVTGLSTAGGMLVLIIGIPLLLLVLGLVRAMALFEGRLVEVLLGTRMPRRPRAEPPNAGFVQRILFWVKDGRTWASMAYMILMLPLGIIYFTVAVTGIAVGLGLITTPLWAWASDYSFTIDGVIYQSWFPLWGVPVAMIGGAIVLLAWLHLVRWIGRGHAAFAKTMLVRLSR